MGLTLADQYYIKAWDNYGYDLAEVVENLNYALSYSSGHTNANCLMGRVYSEYLNNPEQAAYYFEQALSNDLTNRDVIRYYTYMLIHQRDFAKAKKMIDYGYTVKGMNQAMLMHYEALLAEYQKDYKKAIKLLKSAQNESYSEREANFLKSEISRVKAKTKQTKEKGKSDKPKKKKKAAKKKKN